MIAGALREKIAAALDPRFYSLPWLDEQIASGRALVWQADAAAIVAEVRTYPTGARELHGLIAAGDLDEIADVLIPQAEDWAKRAGCIATVIESREGWARRLKGAGYEVHQVAVRKEL